MESVSGDLDVCFKGVQVIADLNLDLAAIGAVAGTGKAYVGFAARSGGACESHDITRWVLTEGSRLFFRVEVE